MKLFNKNWIFAMFFASTVACEPSCLGPKKTISAEDRLHSYVSTAVNVTRPEQKQDLIDLTTGPLKESLLNASESSFRKAYLDRRYEFKSFEITNKTEVSGIKQVVLDYKLVYRTWLSGEIQERAALQEIKNKATLNYENGQWSIYSVENLDHGFQWEVGMPLDGVTTAGITPESEPVEVKSSREEKAEELKFDQEQAAPEAP